MDKVRLWPWLQYLLHWTQLLLRKPTYCNCADIFYKLKSMGTEICVLGIWSLAQVPVSVTLELFFFRLRSDISAALQICAPILNHFIQW